MFAKEARLGRKFIALSFNNMSDPAVFPGFPLVGPAGLDPGQASLLNQWRRANKTLEVAKESCLFLSINWNLESLYHPRQEFK